MLKNQPVPGQLKNLSAFDNLCLGESGRIPVLCHESESRAAGIAKQIRKWLASAEDKESFAALWDELKSWDGKSLLFEIWHPHGYPTLETEAYFKILYLTNGRAVWHELIAII